MVRAIVSLHMWNYTMQSTILFAHSRDKFNGYKPVQKLLLITNCYKEFYVKESSLKMSPRTAAARELLAFKNVSNFVNWW